MEQEKLDIIYEDEHMLAVNKPAGLMVHGDGRSEEQTLADLLLEAYPNIKEVGEPWNTPEGKVLYRPGIVHRIDKETSGVLLVAKDQESFGHLKKEFQERNVKKEYRAIVHGRIKEDRLAIDLPIGKSRKNFRQWMAGPRARGTMREAHTDVEVIDRSAEYTYIAAYPKTGRTHQIRVHLKAVDHPLVCDRLYAPKRSCVLGLERLALHAYSISITTLQGSVLRIEAPLPKDLERALGEAFGG